MDDLFGRMKLAALFLYQNHGQNIKTTLIKTSVKIKVKKVYQTLIERSTNLLQIVDTRRLPQQCQGLGHTVEEARRTQSLHAYLSVHGRQEATEGQPTLGALRANLAPVVQHHLTRSDDPAPKRVQRDADVDLLQVFPLYGQTES